MLPVSAILFKVIQLRYFVWFTLLWYSATESMLCSVLGDRGCCTSIACGLATQQNNREDIVIDEFFVCANCWIVALCLLGRPLVDCVRQEHIHEDAPSKLLTKSYALKILEVISSFYGRVLTLVQAFSLLQTIDTPPSTPPSLWSVQSQSKSTHFWLRGYDMPLYTLIGTVHGLCRMRNWALFLCRLLQDQSRDYSRLRVSEIGNRPCDYAQKKAKALANWKEYPFVSKLTNLWERTTSICYNRLSPSFQHYLLLGGARDQNFKAVSSR